MPSCESLVKMLPISWVRLHMALFKKDSYTFAGDSHTLDIGRVLGGPSSPLQD